MRSIDPIPPEAFEMSQADFERLKLPEDRYNPINRRAVLILSNPVAKSNWVRDHFLQGDWDIKPETPPATNANAWDDWKPCRDV